MRVLYYARAGYRIVPEDCHSSSKSSVKYRFLGWCKPSHVIGTRHGNKALQTRRMNTPFIVYKHRREDGTVDDNSIYASKVELTDENVLVQVEKGKYEVLQIGAYYTNLILKREYPVYTTQRKEGLKDIIDLMIYVQVFPSVLLGKDEKPLYWDVFYPVESQTYRIICVFRPELGSISTLMGQLNVFRDYIVHDRGVKEIFGRDHGTKEINPRATQGLTWVVVTYDSNRAFDD